MAGSGSRRVKGHINDPVILTPLFWLSSSRLSLTLSIIPLPPAASTVVGANVPQVDTHGHPGRCVPRCGLRRWTLFAFAGL